MPEKDREGIEAQLKRIGELCAERKRDDYESLLKRLTEARELFHGMLAGLVVEKLNEHYAAQPQTDIQEKQTIAKSINSDLRDQLGLAIRCPKTGEPAHLHCAPDTPTGRFQICLTADSNYRRTVSAKNLPHLDLMMRPARGPQSGDGKWTDHADRGNRGRVIE